MLFRDRGFKQVANGPNKVKIMKTLLAVLWSDVIHRLARISYSVIITHHVNVVNEHNTDAILNQDA